MLIKTILKKQDSAKLVQAQKLQVRELEEHGELGNYIAFVDEGEESFDVNIRLKDEHVLTHSCDCKTKDTYCVHQLAVILALTATASTKHSNGKAKKLPAKSRMKESEQLLLDIDPLAVNAWLIDLFKSQKDIELQFVLRFSKNKIDYHPKDITKMLQDVVASVIGKRKKIDAAEVKKIVTMWEKALIPVWEFIQLNITKKEILLLYSALIDGLYNFGYKYQYTGTRIGSFLASCHEKLAQAVNAIVSDITWQSYFNLLWSEVWRKDSNSISMLQSIKLMYNYLSPERKTIYSNRVQSQLEEFVNEGVCFPVEVDDFFLDIMIDSGKLEHIFFYFGPKAWENKFNLKLIKALKEYQPQIAIDFCVQMIQTNVNTDYNLPYLDIMEELFQKFNNIKGLVGVKMDKFTFNPNVADLHFIMKHVHNDEIKNRFRNNTLSRYRNSLNHPLYADIYFGILVFEKNYEKMLKVIDYNIGVYVLLKYWDLMYAYDKVRLVKAIAGNFHIQYDTDMDAVDGLVDKLIENYDQEFLRNIFKPNSRSTYLRTLKGLVYGKLKL